MFTLRTSNVNSAKAMSIKVNTKETDITVYDKVGLKHATGVEVIPLLSSVNTNFKKFIAYTIASSLKLSDSSKDLYYTICDEYSDKDNISIKSVVTKASLVHGKTEVTYRRSIEELICKGVVSRDSRNNVLRLRAEYNIGVYYEHAKYIVIEVKPRG